MGWVVCYLQSLRLYLENNKFNFDSISASSVDLLLACHVSFFCDEPKEAIKKLNKKEKKNKKVRNVEFYVQSPIQVVTLANRA